MPGGAFIGDPTEHTRPVSRIVVAVIDSGWDATSENGRVRRGASVIERSKGDDGLPVWHDRNGHGTMCTDIILRAAPLCEVVPIRLFGEELVASTTDLVRALELARVSRAQIVNMSLGIESSEDLTPLRNICDRLFAAGVTMFAAAEDPLSVIAPASFDSVVGVYSGSHGPSDCWVVPGQSPMCVAYGNAVAVRRLGGGTHSTMGTSVATAFASGLAARLAHELPTLSPGGLLNAIQSYHRSRRG